MAKTLEGIKVVLLATFIAAPAAARYLTDYGAEVIWIESDKGDALRHTGPQEGRIKSVIENTTVEYLHGNQKCVSLNVKTPEGMDALHRMLAKADVFVTNWRFGALERAGLSYDILKEKYPTLIYAMALGYGLTGPDRDLPGYDFTAFWGRGGYTNNLSKRGESPITMIPALGDNNAGLVLALGIMTALLKRTKTGKGDLVTASLYETAIWNQSIMLMGVQYDGQAHEYPIRFIDNKNPLNNAYVSSDARVIQIAMPDYDVRVEHFLEVIGRHDLFETGKFWPQTKMVEIESYPELIESIKEWFAGYTKDEIADIFVKGDIPFSVAYNWDEIMNDPQANAIGAFYDCEMANGVVKKVTHTPVRLASEMDLPTRRAPWIGENTEEVLKDLGYSDDEIKGMFESGAAYTWDPSIELGDMKPVN